MATLTPPSAEYILALKGELQALYKDDDAQIDRTRQDRELKNPIPMAEAWRKFAVEVRDPTMSDEIQRTAAELSINPPTLTCKAAVESEKAQENATLREEWTQAVLNEAGRRIPGVDTFSFLVDSVVGDGGGWCSFENSRDLWDVRYSLSPSKFTDDPVELDDQGKVLPHQTGARKYVEASDQAKKVAGSPFIWSPVDARVIYPDFQGVKLGAVLEVMTRSRSSTLRQYRLKLDDKGNIVPDELRQGTNSRASVSGPSVEFLKYYDDTWCGYVIAGKNSNGDDTQEVARDRNNKPLMWQHRYGRPPYFYSPGLLQNQWRNRKVGWGVGESMRYLVELRSWLLTALSQGVGRDLNVSWFRTLPDGAQATLGDDGKPKVKETFEANLIYTGASGEQITLFPYPPVGDSLKMMLEVVNTLIAGLKSPQVNSLSGLEGAGFAVNQVLSYAKVKFSPLAQSSERMLAEMTEFMWYLSRQKVKERIWVYSRGEKLPGFVSVEPNVDLAPGKVRIEWQLNPEQPSDKLILNRYLTERQQAGSLGMDEVIERLGDNPDEIRLSRARDDIRASSEYKKLLQGQVIQQIGRGDLLTEAAQAQQVAQTGMIPPAMGTSIMPDQGQAALGPPGQTAGAPSIPTQSGAATALTP